MKFLCKLFGHSWKCYMAISSRCRWCGIDYTEFVQNASNLNSTKEDKE